MPYTSEDASRWLWILKLLDSKSPALDLHLQTNMLSLFQSLTEGEREEAIGLISSLRDKLGALYASYSWIELSLKSSRTEPTISPSFGDLTE